MWQHLKFYHNILTVQIMMHLNVNNEWLHHSMYSISHIVDFYFFLYAGKNWFKNMKAEFNDEFLAYSDDESDPVFKQ